MTTRGPSSQTAEISSGRMSLSVDPHFGARVTDLTDNATGRQWLLTGPRAPDASEAASYLGMQSRGWDECFPTILPCSCPEWGGRLRDHGMLWGKSWTIVEATQQVLTTRFAGDGIRFDRRLVVSGPEVTASYAVTSSRAAAVPYMWSQHCVLRLTEDDRIGLRGQGQMSVDGISFEWPDYLGRDLTRVGPEGEGFVLKAYAPVSAAATARVTGPHGGLQFDWHGEDLGSVGLWLDYGGWPQDAPLHQVAIEPTTAAADDLSGALALGQERWLQPGETHKWSVRLTLLDPETGVGR